MPDNIVATTLAIPDSPPLQPAHGDPATWVLGSAAGVIASAFFWVRRRLSRDKTEMLKDRAEEGVIAQLRDLVIKVQEERDRAHADAREAWARRTADAELIAAYRAENEYLKRDVQRLSEEVHELQESVAILRSALTRITGAPPAPPVLSLPSA